MEAIVRGQCGKDEVSTNLHESARMNPDLFATDGAQMNTDIIQRPYFNLDFLSVFICVYLWPTSSAFVPIRREII
jgi:hypothetical protein